MKLFKLLTITILSLAITEVSNLSAIIHRSADDARLFAAGRGPRGGAFALRGRRFAAPERADLELSEVDTEVY